MFGSEVAYTMERDNEDQVKEGGIADHRQNLGFVRVGTGTAELAIVNSSSVNTYINQSGAVCVL